MYKCVKLNKTNFNLFKKLNKRKNEFNSLNRDFFDLYNKANFIQKFMLKSKVRLLVDEDNYIGYIWTNLDKDRCDINALNIIGDKNLELAYKYLINSINNNITINYLCESNNYNYNILKKIGFRKESGTIELKLNLSHKDIDFKYNKELEFKKLQLNKHEEARCYLQNEIFKSNNRVPLNLNDIYYDEKQDYYIEGGSIILVKNHKYIGYGQIIKEKDYPLIVNFGILEGYRRKGYARDLLYYLLRISREKGYEKVMIKVDSNNYKALNLYESIGFKRVVETCNWQLKK